MNDDKQTSQDEFCYSHDGERFEGRHGTREDALEQGRDDEPGEIVTTGRGVRVTFANYLYRSHVEELVQETVGIAAYNDVGECAEDWPRASKDEIDDLHKRITTVLTKWADDHNLQPSFHRVADIIEHPAKAETSDEEPAAT